MLHRLGLRPLKPVTNVMKEPKSMLMRASAIVVILYRDCLLRHGSRDQQTAGREGLEGELGGPAPVIKLPEVNSLPFASVSV